MSWVNRGPLLAFSLFAILSLLAIDHNLKVQHDSGIYITLGKALATGQGYREIFFADRPPHTRYPPIFPLLLTPLTFLLGYHIVAMKLLIVAMAIIALYLLYIFFREFSDDLMVSLVLMFTATSHGVLFYSQSIMTEIPYLCFSLLALFWLNRCSHEEVWSAKAIAMAVLLISLAYLTRLIGLSLLLGLIVYLFLDARGGLGIRSKKAIMVGGLAAVPAVVWLLYTESVDQSGDVLYQSDYRMEQVYSPRSTSDGLNFLFGRVSTNLSKYAIHFARVIFFDAPRLSEIVLPLVLVMLIGSGFLWCVIRRRTVVEYYVIFYMCGVLLFPGTRPQRYLVPLIPFIWYYFWTACRQIFSWLRGKALFAQPSLQRWVVLPGALFVGILLVANVTTAVLGNVVYDGNEGYYHVVGEEGYISVVPWVKAETPPDSVFIWGKPSLRFLQAERKAVDYPRRRNAEALLQFIRLRNVDYVVVDSFSELADQYLRMVVENNPDHFRLVYEDDVSKVYKVLDG